MTPSTAPPRSSRRSTCSTSPTSSRSTSSTSAAPGRAARRAQAVPAQPQCCSTTTPTTMPVFGTIASQFNDPGVERALPRADGRARRASDEGAASARASTPRRDAERRRARHPARARALPGRDRRGPSRATASWVQSRRRARALYQLHGRSRRARAVGGRRDATPLRRDGDDDASARRARARRSSAVEPTGARSRDLDGRACARSPSWDAEASATRDEQFSYKVRDKTIEVETSHESLSGTQVPKVALPRYEDWGDLPALASDRRTCPARSRSPPACSRFKRAGEDPTRMFAGEGGPERTNRRFHYVSAGQPAKRLSTAFDSVTLYGEDPDQRPDIYGKVGNSGVSVATRRRRQEALLRLRPLRPDDVGVDDDQRPRADAARVLHERGHRPAVREVHPRARAGRRRGRARRSTRSTPSAGVPRPPTSGDLPEGNDGLGLRCSASPATRC